ncbi:MAG: hypothetical protein Q9170_007127 [Blastenia crenularia]
MSTQDGVATGTLPYDPIQYTILSACTAVAWIFSVELILAVVFSIRRRSNNVYFWCILVASVGCIVHALGFILKFLVGPSWVVDMIFVGIGWVAMVSGQSFVLWSRLNLVVRSKRILHGVLAAIIIDGIALHTPTLVFIYGANSPSGRWIPQFNTMERVQLLGFSIQEFAIGGIYIFATAKLLKAVYYTGTRKAMIQLLIINCICLSMDLILIGLEFSSYYVAEASVKPLIYAIKLKLEYAVYSQLVGFTKAAFEDDEEIECIESSGGITHQPRQHYNSPAEFFKNIPKILQKPPPIAAYPTIHTHPAELMKANRGFGMDKIDREWDSSQLELSPSNAAAALTAGGKGATTVPRNPRLVTQGLPMNRVRPTPRKQSKDSDGRGLSEVSLALSQSGLAERQNYEP